MGLIKFHLYEAFSKFGELLDNDELKLIIRTENALEFEKLIEILKSLEYTWRGGDPLITFKVRGEKPINIHIYKKGKNITYSSVGYDKEIPFGELFLDWKEGKKIRKPEIDPFDEEKWGYVQESIDYEINFPFETNIVVKTQEEYYELMRLLEERGFIWRSGHDPTYFNYFDPNESKNGVFLTSNKKIGGIQIDRYKSINFKNIPRKIKKRLKKPEIDPFGEENWGYVQEGLDIGTNVIYNGEEHWDRRGEEALVIGNKPNYQGEIINIIRFKDGKEHDCMDKLLNVLVINKRKKIENPKVDPFGEETWYSVQEGVENEGIFFIDEIFDRFNGNYDLITHYLNTLLKDKKVIFEESVNGNYQEVFRGKFSEICQATSYDKDREYDLLVRLIEEDGSEFSDSIFKGDRIIIIKERKKIPMDREIDPFGEDTFYEDEE